MSASQAKRYAPIDVHRKAAPDGWPATIPPMTNADAFNAVSRLFRFALRRSFDGEIKITSGNRRACSLDHRWVALPKGRDYRLSATVNPSQGWRDFIHDISHELDRIANGGSEHGRHHARFEAKLVREVIKRGWLEPKAEVVKPEKPKPDPFELKLKRLSARHLSWTRKRARADNALKKLGREINRTVAARERAAAKAAS